jgi:hypothetical protein
MASVSITSLTGLLYHIAGDVSLLFERIAAV